MNLSMTYNEISSLINEENYTLAETKLKQVNSQDAQWHFLYSFILLQKAWFDSAKTELEKALALAPNNVKYQEALTKLMRRHYDYSNDYYRRPRRHGDGCCCCCCDDCCGSFSCCDLICLDTCCECMGGDLISCI